jgi:Glycosyltransferases involved in cell wall biogenesis
MIPFRMFLKRYILGMCSRGINQEDEYSPFWCTMVKVSVIVPIYNSAQYLVECLESIVRQTLKDIEIICVNDGSTDGSLKIIEEYAARDDRIIVITGENAGYGSAMNKGLDRATGEYVGIVESDDYVSPEMYEELYGTASAHDLDFIKSDFYRFTTNSGRIFNYVDLTERNEFYDTILNPQDDLELFYAVMNTWCGIYKRDFLNGNNIRHNESPGASFQDNGFWFQTFALGKKIQFVRKPFYFNRRDNESSSVFNKENIDAMRAEYDFIKGFIDTEPESRERLIPIYHYMRFRNYLFTYGRIDSKNRRKYLTKIKKEFRPLFVNEELERKFFPKNHWKILLAILFCPRAYHLFRNIKSNPTNAYPQFSGEHFSPASTCKISVVMPVYNAERHLETSIKSVLAQTEKDIELICINDGSTDSTFSILKRLSEENPKIIMINQRNIGAGLSRNRGIQLSRGEYIAFLDSDDCFPDSESLFKMHSCAEEFDVQVCGGMRECEDRGSVIDSRLYAKEYSSHPEGTMLYYKDYQYDYHFVNYIYSSKLLKDNDIMFPSYQRYQDPPFFVKAMFAAEKYFFAPVKSYRYHLSRKKIDWNDDCVGDLIMGLTDNLIFSKERSLNKLHETTIRRIETEFNGVIANKLRIAKIRNLLDSFYGNIDYNLIGEREIKDWTALSAFNARGKNISRLAHEMFHRLLRFIDTPNRKSGREIH